MNATTLYVSTCRYILQADFENCESWADLYRLLPYLRQSLSCCVCGALLDDPQGPTDSNCQHFVCRTCVGGKMLLKPSCSWCKDYAKFADVLQLRILLSCYKKLCEYIAATPIARSLVGANGESNSTLTILQEGMAINATHESANVMGTDKTLNILDILAKANSHDKTRANNSKSPRRRRGQRQRQRDSDSTGLGEGGSPAPSGASGSGNPEVGSPTRLDGLSNGLDSSDHQDTGDNHHSFCSTSVSGSDSSRVKLKRKHHGGDHKSKAKKKKKKRDKDKQRKLDGEKSRHGSGSRSRSSRSSSERKKRRHKSRKDESRKDKQISSAKEIAKEKEHKEELKEVSKEEEPLEEPSTKEKLTNGDLSPTESELGPDTPKKLSLVISGHRAKLLKAGKSLPPISGCRCGTWNRHPGLNTCCGNRCPCFMEEKGCGKCKCKGCRNPFNGDVAEKKKSRAQAKSDSKESPQKRDTNGDSDLDIDVTDI
ncbi:uncharacterized protein [Diadema setosum]|uniref:uncharacterized protein n=1 Tax=Diadema setosum TaxID=31175 RepID=UPI003B3A2181